MFDESSSSYYRFTKKQLEQQKDDLVVYYLERLSDETPEKVKEEIQLLKKMTGYDISLDAALLIKRLVTRAKNIPNQELDSQVNKKTL